MLNTLLISKLGILLVTAAAASSSSSSKEFAPIHRDRAPMQRVAIAPMNTSFGRTLPRTPPSLPPRHSSRMPIGTSAGGRSAAR